MGVEVLPIINFVVSQARLQAVSLLPASSCCQLGEDGILHSALNMRKCGLGGFGRFVGVLSFFLCFIWDCLLM